MPPNLPHISGPAAIRAHQNLGFIHVRQKGSHVILRRGAAGCVVPKYEEIKIGALSGVLKQAGVSLDEFMAVL